jgi:hypothetical protein
MLVTPRLISKSEAATYCGLSLSSFSDWQRRGIVPGPVPGTHRWDRKALDSALDKMSGITTQSEEISAYDQWKAKQA